MINNPDMNPSAVINRWVAGILLFDFKLVHIPGVKHGVDGLSRRRPQPGDEPAQGDDPDWVDKNVWFRAHHQPARRRASIGMQDSLSNADFG